MKNIFLTLVLIMTTMVGKAQKLMDLKVDSAYLFEYSDTMSFEDAWNSGQITNLGVVRRYDESMKRWVINLHSREITFGDYEPRQIIQVENENNKLVYKNGLGQTCKLFMMKNSENGEEMVFFLDEPKAGKVKGGFAYPTERMVL